MRKIHGNKQFSVQGKLTWSEPRGDFTMWRVPDKEGSIFESNEQWEKEDEEKMMYANRGGNSPRKQNVARMKGMNEVMPEEEDDEEEDDEDELSMDGEVDLEAARKKRLASMGEKVAELGRNAYMCAVIYVCVCVNYLKKYTKNIFYYL